MAIVTAVKAEDEDSQTLPALTSTFTPAPDCTTFEMQFCDKNACSASDGGDDEPRFSCYPNITHYSYKDSHRSITERGRPALTYSPGLHCPHGMTTASSLDLLDAVYCCYSNFEYQSEPPYLASCVKKLTEGAFFYSSSTIAFGPSETDAFTSIAHGYGGLNWTGPPLLEAIADPIFLISIRAPASVSEILSTTDSFSKGSSRSTGQTSIQTDSVEGTPPENPQDSSTNNKVKIIGSVVGVVIFLLFVCSGLLYLKCYRRKRLRRAERGTVTTKDQQWLGPGDKPELEGSRADRARFLKAELDALAVRAELEGSLGEEHDSAGIGFIKPELQGTSGVWGILGVFIKGKAELEAPSNQGAGKRSETRSFSPVQKQSFTNCDNTEPVELDSRSIPAGHDLVWEGLYSSRITFPLVRINISHLFAEGYTTISHFPPRALWLSQDKPHQLALTSEKAHTLSKTPTASHGGTNGAGKRLEYWANKLSRSSDGQRQHFPAIIESGFALLMDRRSPLELLLCPYCGRMRSNRRGKTNGSLHKLQWHTKLLLPEPRGLRLIRSEPTMVDGQPTIELRFFFTAQDTEESTTTSSSIATDLDP
ncbi:hypothetical protein F5Y09DRAFT_346134 [Xylaria sp. FL1042]|nr:hypothetical protein F5Y09DRAFT_346134 [Xylaria sp. FL1042]